MSGAWLLLVPFAVALVLALALGRGAAREDRAWEYARENAGYRNRGER